MTEHGYAPELQAPASAPARLRLLRLAAVMERVGLSRAQIYKLVAAGRFPGPVALTDRAVAWPEHEIEGWIRARMAARVQSSSEAAPVANHTSS